MNRRSLLTGLVSLIAALAIVRAGSLMPVRGDVYRFWQTSLPLLPDIREGLSVEEAMAEVLGPNGRVQRCTWTLFGKGNIYTDECVDFHKEEYPVAVAS